MNLGQGYRIFFLGLIVMVLWPRYLYLPLAGRGLSIYNALSIVLLDDALLRIVSNPVTRARVRAAFGSFRALMIITTSYFAVRFVCDGLGDTPLISLRFTVAEIVIDASWMLIAVVYINSEQRFRTMMQVLAGCGVVFFLASFLEFYENRPLTDVLHLRAIQVGDKAELNVLDDASSTAGRLRIKGLFVHPIIFGQIAGVFVVIGLHQIRFGRPLDRFAGFFLVAAQLSLPRLTEARSTLVSSVIALVVYYFVFNFQFRSRRQLFALGFGVVALAVATPFVIQSAQNLIYGTDAREKSSSAGRQLQLYLGQKAIVRQPIVGYGSNTSLKYAGVSSQRNVPTIDNNYLSEAIDHGLPGLVLFVMMLVAMSLTAVRSAMTEATDEFRSGYAAMAAVIVSLGVGLSIISLTQSLSYLFFATGVAMALFAMRNAACLARWRRPTAAYGADYARAGARPFAG